MKIVVHISGKFTPLSDEVEGDSVTWSDNAVIIDVKNATIYYPREKVVKVEVIK